MGKIKKIVKKILPRPVLNWYHRLKPPSRSKQPVMNGQTYERVYERHARECSPATSVGDGDFDIIGRIELQILLMEGLTPQSVLYDFGCGTGRLAVHAIPWLTGGRYFGSDISRTMLQHADKIVRSKCPGATCQVEWIHQTRWDFPEWLTQQVDVICAFSVFTHMEHEDAYRYLVAAKNIVKPGGKFIFSCLPLNQPLGRQVFLDEAAMDLEERWNKVRCMVTSVDLMNNLAQLAGWKVVRWNEGEDPNIPVPGQSTCVLQLLRLIP
jgi:SAM-dependent methyltransferase